MNRRLADYISGSVLVICLLLIGATVWLGIDERRDKVAALDTSMANLSRSIVQYAEDTLDVADTAVSGIVEDVQSNDWTLEFLNGLHRRMARQVAATERLKGLFVYDAAGNWIASSLASFPRALNNSDRSYFRYHSSTEDSSPFVAAPVRSRSSSEWIVTLTRRIDNPDGSFGGVVLASIDVAHLARFFSKFDVGAEGTITLLNKRGIVLGSKDHLETMIGSDRSDDPSLRPPEGSPATWNSHFASMLDGSERIGATSRGARYGLVAATSLSMSEAFRSIEHGFQVRLVIAIVFSAIFCVVGFQLARHVRISLDAEVQLRRLAETDPLTGLANRRSFQVRLNDWIASNRAFTLLLIDLDRFKVVNDTYGHAAGDDLLVQVVHRLSKIAKGGDFAARLGGDELAMLVPDTSQDAAFVARSLVAEVARPFEIAGATLHIGCSIGLCHSRHAAEEKQIMQRADLALYTAKHRGRGNFVEYRDEMKQASA